MTGEAPGPPQRRKGVQGGSGLARHWFHGRFQASALPLVKPWAVLRSAGLLKGPGSLARHWIRSGSRLPFGPLAGQPPPAKTLAALRERKACAPRSLGFRRRFPTPYPGGKRQPRFRREQRAGWADAPSLAQRLRENAFYPGASGGPDSAANSGRAGPTPPAGRLSPRTGARGAPRPLFVTFSRQRK